MSDNPFSKNPEAYSVPASSPQQPGTRRPEKPLLLNVFCVLALILSLLGILTVLMTVLGLVFQDKLMEMAASLTPDQETLEKAQALQDKQFIPNMAFTVISLFVSTFLAFGSITCLLGKPGGRRNFVKASLVALIFVTLRSVWQLAFQFMNRDAIVEMNDVQGGQGEMAFTLTIVMVAVISIGMILFYLGSIIVARMEDAKAYFGD